MSETEVQEPAFEETVEESIEESIEQPPEEKSEDKPKEQSKEVKEEVKEEAKDESRQNRRKRRTQQYINNLKHEAETNKEQAAYWRGKAEALETKEPELIRPLREDYISEDDYLTDVLDYRDQVKALKEPEKPAEKTEPPKALDVERQSKLYEAGVKTYGEDFTEAMQDTSLAISPLMGEYVLDSEVGADVYMLLADNPDKATEIFNMKSVAQQVRALDAIESGIKSSDQGQGVNSPDEGQAEKKTPPQQIPQRKVTQAPPPASHEKGGSVPDMDESKMSDAEWFKKEKARAAN